MPPDDLKPVYLIAGKDRPKIQRAVERLRRHFDPSSVEHLSADDVSGAEAVAACNAMGLFAAEGRLVLVTEVDGRRNRDDRLVGGWKAADVDAVVAYLADPAPGTVLALVAEGVRKDSALAKAVAKRGDVLLYDVDDRRLAEWARRQLAEVGAKAEPEAVMVLLDLVGERKEELRLEIEKLALWAEGAEITAPDVEELVASRGPFKPWDLTDAWGRRDIPGVLGAASRALRRPDVTPTSLAWKLADHVSLVVSCRRFATEGVSAGEAARRLRKKEFPVRKAFAQAEAWDDSELSRVIVRLARLDADLKGGSRLPDGLVLEQALVDVTRGVPAPAKAVGA